MKPRIEIQELNSAKNLELGTKRGDLVGNSACCITVRT